MNRALIEKNLDSRLGLFGPETIKVRLIERVEQPRSLQILDSRHVFSRSKPEVGEEVGRGGVKQWPPRPLAASRGAHPARFHQHVERALGGLDTADRLDLGAADGLVIGDDREGLGRGARQAAWFFARAAQDVGEVGRGLEMPSPPALDEVDAVPGVDRRESGQRGGDIALPCLSGDLVRRERRGRS